MAFLINIIAGFLLGGIFGLILSLSALILLGTLGWIFYLITRMKIFKSKPYRILINFTSQILGNKIGIISFIISLIVTVSNIYPYGIDSLSYGTATFTFSYIFISIIKNYGFKSNLIELNKSEAEKPNEEAIRLQIPENNSANNKKISFADKTLIISILALIVAVLQLFAQLMKG